MRIVIGALSGLALLGGVWGALSHHRAVVAERDSAVAQFETCRGTNQANQETIETLEAQAAENEANYQAALERANQASARAETMEQQLEAEADAEIVEITRALDGDHCARLDMPRAVRMRIDPRSAGRVPDGAEPGRASGAGAGRPDPGSGPA